VSLVFLNLFVAIILKNFEDLNSKENQLLTDANMKHLRECWAYYDRDATSFIKVNDFIPFLSMLGPPFGFDNKPASLKM